uniref:Uncharacterized protein n=1 Tax=Hucho hucho TaxID=62062 RepID=A0A4W5M9F4_9TELE
MIQSSQPISLKLTCSCFLWQRGLGFLASFLPRMVGARRIRRWVNRYSYTNKSRFFVRPNTRKKAFSLVCLPRRLKPVALRSTGRPRSKASSSKQSWTVLWKFLNSFQMSNTSHLGVLWSSMVRVWSSVAFCLPAAQVKSFRQKTLPVESALCGSASLFLRMRSSAPSNPSFSRELMLKLYFCLLSWRRRSSRTGGELAMSMWSEFRSPTRDTKLTVSYKSIGRVTHFLLFWLCGPADLK